MTLKNHIFATLSLSALVLAAAGCSDSDDWQPGPDTAADCMGVYFGEMKSNLIIGPDDSRLIPVTIGRAKSDQAVTMAVNTISAPEGVTVPASVEFAADQKTATLFIDIENMPSKSSGTVSLALPEDMTSPYAAGTPTLTFTLTVSGAWVPVSKDVTLSTGGVYPDTKTSLYYLDGTNTFKLPDFFGSGLDLTFEMTTPGNGWTYIKPTSNYIDSKTVWADMGWGEPYGPGWFLYDSKNDNFPDYWSPDGVSYPQIDLLEFEDSYCTMTLIEDESRHGYISMEPFVYYVGSEGNKYVTLTYTFTTENTPFPTDN